MLIISIILGDPNLNLVGFYNTICALLPGRKIISLSVFFLFGYWISLPLIFFAKNVYFLIKTKIEKIKEDIDHQFYKDLEEKKKIQSKKESEKKESPTPSQIVTQLIHSIPISPVKFGSSQDKTKASHPKTDPSSKK